MINDSIKFTREQLYNEIWKISVTGVAKKYNLDYSKLKNICKEYDIPSPKASYWAKKNMKIDVSDEIVQLPKFDKEEIEIPLKNNAHLSLNVIDEKDKFIQEFKFLNFLNEKERKEVAKTIFDLSIDKYKKKHKSILDYQNRAKEERKKERQDNYYNPYYSVHDYVETGYFVNVSKFEKERAMKILSAIYFTIEQLGGKVNEDFSMKIKNEMVTMEIEELKDQVNHELTKDEAKKLLEYEEKKKKEHYAYKPNIRKYDYVYNGKLKITFESKNYIKETDKFKLESGLADIVIKLYEKAEETRIEREQKEEQKRKQEEARKIEVDFKNRKKEEATKIQKLINNSDDYQIASKIRNYIKAVESKGNLEEETKEWIKWANKKADWFDPTIDVKDELLGKRNHEESKENKNIELNKHISYYGW